VEKLDGRVMLSGDISFVKVIDKATPLLAVAESAALTPIAGESTDAKHKGEFVDLGNNFLKLNSIFMEYEEDIVNLKVTPDELSDVTHKINDVFVKINLLANDLDHDTGLLLPAVQKVREAALGKIVPGTVGLQGGLLSDLSKILPSDVSVVPDDERAIFIKMGGEFWKLDEALIKYKVDLIQGVPTDVALKQVDDKIKQEFLKIKLDQVLVSSFLDEGQKKDVDTLIQDSVGLINGVIHPNTDTDLTFLGGVTVPGGAGDTIV